MTVVLVDYILKCVAFYSFKNVQDWLYVEHYLLHRTTTVHLVILMWITSCKISWGFAVNGMISSTVMWACCNVQCWTYCHKSHWKWKSNFLGMRSSTAFFTCVHSKNALLTSCQLSFLVPLSSFLAHLLAHSHILLLYFFLLILFVRSIGQNTTCMLCFVVFIIYMFCPNK